MNKKCLPFQLCAVCFFAGLFFLAQSRYGKRVDTVRIPVAEAERVRERTLTLIFAGDLMQHLPQVAAASDRGGTIDYTPCFRLMKPYFESADFVVVNLETTLGGAPYSGYPRFRSPRELAWDMRRSGIDAAVLANNHICDRGDGGISSTLEALASSGIPSTGVFADSADYRSRGPLRLRKNGFDVALLNYTYGTNGLPVPSGRGVNRIDSAAIGRDIRAAKRAGATDVAVFLHWGDEYVRVPGREQRLLAEFCHRAGAGLVIGSHPHVVQPVETLADGEGRVCGVTVFSLGNFISNQRQPDTDGGMTVRITLVREGSRSVEYRPEYLLHWTHIAPDANTASGRRYEAVPAYFGREIGPSGREAFARYLSRTRALLSEHASSFREIETRAQGENPPVLSR